MSQSQSISDILKSTPPLFRGPGGAIAVVRDGELVDKHVWGYADLNERIAMTAETLLPICSISKQMVCQMVMSIVKESDHPDEIWQRFDTELRAMLPDVFKTDEGKELTIHDLCNNQSGIRDYWGMSVLWGAKPEDVFNLEKDAPKAIERTRSLHFAPGTEFSYCNLNFHIVARILEKISGNSLDKLLQERLFKSAGMTTARLNPDNGNLPGPCVGYEVDEERGFFPAINRMQWSGDAGVVASLGDMIAYEKYLHQSWKDPNSLYRAIATDPKYRDGSPATYGYGLGHTLSDGRHFLGHGGMLRGFRLHRIHEPNEKISVIVMFNHEADAAGAAAKHILKQILRVKEDDGIYPSSSYSNWKGNTGAYLDQTSRLKIEVALGDPEKDEILLTYAGYPEKLKATSTSASPIQAESESMHASIVEGVLTVKRYGDHRTLIAHRIPEVKDPGKTSDFLGEYHCAEVESTFHLSGEGGMLYGSFDGFLGKGPVHLVRYLGGDVCSLSCPRGLDAPAPGDWTLYFGRDEDGKVNQVTIGCWLAKTVVFVKRG